ncbi:hypothetical protein BXZ70DRAFT_723797 [Cristinia sonorae]|uniref:HMG box domain-containing protein n=1 Tax=Cristinia sonorae TaxID=1940300 RepID=A0A8K0UVA6_9AGAR|nr:hypothetical protein BXZ70DRAFT_723797 [Cristinia sonorae]
MAPIRNHRRAPTPAPYTTSVDQLRLGYPPSTTFEQDLVLAPLPAGTFSSIASSPALSSSAFTSPSTSENHLSTPSPAIIPSSLRSSPAPRKHSRKKADQHVRRPPNPFIIFRSAFWDEEKKKPSFVKDHRVISKLAGEAWNRLTDEEQAPYRRKALEAKLQHQEANPEYKFTPIGKRGSSSTNLELPSGEEQEARCKMIAEFVMEGLRGPQLALAIQQLDAGLQSGATPFPISNSSLDANLPQFSVSYDDLAPFPKIEQESPVVIPELLQPQLFAAPVQDVAPVPVDPQTPYYYTPEISQEPFFSDPLLSGIPASSTPSTSSSPPLDPEAAELLYATLMGTESDFTNAYPGDNLTVPLELPLNSDELALVYPQEVTEFQGALGFQPYFDAHEREFLAPLDVGEPLVVFPEEDAQPAFDLSHLAPAFEQDPPCLDNFAAWFNSDSF